jgi:putative peptidoglycan lipid II flippase
MLLLRTTMNARIGRSGLRAAYVSKLWVAAAAGAAIAWVIKLTIPSVHPVLTAIFVLGAYGALYLGTTWLLGVGEATMTLARIVRTKGR